MSASQLEGWDVRSIATEWIAVALPEQELSPQPPRQEAQFRLWPAANCRHEKFKKKTMLVTWKKDFAWNKYRRVKPCTTCNSKRLQHLLLDALCTPNFSLLWCKKKKLIFGNVFKSFIRFDKWTVSTKLHRMGLWPCRKLNFQLDLF